MVEHNQSQYYGNQYKFNGKELDAATGMYYYGARYYDPRISIFISVDPLAEQFVGWTPYHYVHQNPINLIDPTGMSADGWVEQQKDDKTTLTFNPDVCTEEEATAAGYENVTGVFNDTRVASENSDVTFNPDGTVTGIELRPSKSIPGSFYGYTEGGTEVVTPIFQEGINFRQPGYTIPIGEAFDITGASGVLGEIIVGLFSELTGNSEGGVALALVATKGKVSTSLNVHGNSLKSMRPTWGYKLFSNDGKFLKNGITSKAIPEKRYTNGFMKDKYMDAIKFPNRREAYDWEALQNKIKKGPLNKNNH